MSRKFAVFDIDGTVARTSLFAQIVDRLVLNGDMPSSARTKIDAALEAYRSRQHQAAFSDYELSFIDILFDNLHTLEAARYRAVVDKVVAECKDRVYVYTRDLIASLRAEGYFLVALSGSEMYAVQQFGAHHGFDLAVGEVYVEQSGRFTGKVNAIYGKKSELLQQIVEDHRLDFGDSIGVGDTKGDIAMLSLVKQPIAFNPEQQLLQHARTEGWKIVVERKNVIYELEPRDGSYLLAQTNV